MSNKFINEAGQHRNINKEYVLDSNQIYLHLNLF